MDLIHDLTDLDFVEFLLPMENLFQKKALHREKASHNFYHCKIAYCSPAPIYAYRNKGDITFSNEKQKLGHEIPSMSNGCRTMGFDNDGDLDMWSTTF